MIVAGLKLYFHVPQANSLKDKRRVLQSLISQLRKRFLVSVAEVEDQDVHRSIVLGVALVAAHQALADQVMDHLLEYLDHYHEAELIKIERECY